METVVMPAGEYVICDPCYVIPDEHWDRFIEVVPEGELHQFQMGDSNIWVWYASTEFGDGSYDAISYHGTHEIGVDSGCIGVIQTFKGMKNSRDFLQHNARRKFDIEYDGSTFNIGPWEITTGDMNELEYDDDIFATMFDDECDD